MTYATNPVIHENQKLLGRGAISERTAICSPIELLILRLIVIRDRGRKIKNLATALFVRLIHIRGKHQRRSSQKRSVISEAGFFYARFGVEFHAALGHCSFY